MVAVMANKDETNRLMGQESDPMVAMEKSL
jgi:hypothetical protein